MTGDMSGVLARQQKLFLCLKGRVDPHESYNTNIQNLSSQYISTAYIYWCHLTSSASLFDNLLIITY
jgi:hypothetical protein